MKDMTLEEHFRPSLKGDFGEEVKDDTVYLSHKVYQILTEVYSLQGSLSKPALLVGCLKDFPEVYDDIAQKLNWTTDEVKAASEKFCEAMRQYLPKELYEGEIIQHPFGALPPEKDSEK